jgi:CHAT domain-containing protein
MRGQEGGPTNDEDLNLAIARARKAASDNPTAENFRLLGVAYVLAARWNEAVAQLENAHGRNPADARILSDLAAAHYARAKQLQRDDEFRKAYELAAAAVKANPSLAEARFNEALALQALNFKEEAQAAWNEYLKLDPSSPWADEARARIRAPGLPWSSWDAERGRLQMFAAAGDWAKVGEIVGRFPRETRLYTEEELLPRWAAAGKDDHGQSLPIAKAVGEALAARTGDYFLRDSVRTIENAQTRSDQSLEGLRSAYGLYSLGRVSYRANRIGDALGEFRRAEGQFLAVRSPFFALAVLGQVSCLFYEGSFSESLDKLRALEATTGPTLDDYHAVAGQLHWLRGLVRLGQGYPYESLESYRLALARFEHLGESEGIAAVRNLMAENLRYLGETDSASIQRYQALRLLNERGSPARLHPALAEVGRSALAEGNAEMADLAAGKMFRLAANANNRLFATDALILRARSRQTAGDLDGARQALQDAVRQCEGIPDEKLRSRSRADVAMAIAEVEFQADPKRALSELDRVIPFLETTGTHFRFARALLERGRLKRGAGDEDAALRDYIRGIGELEGQRERISNEELRALYFETARGLFEETIDLLTRRGEARTAFEYADRARSRVLLDSLSRPSAVTDESPGTYAPLPAATIAARLPANTVLVEYFVLPDRLLTWSLSVGSFSLQQTRIGSSRLGEMVEKFADAIEAERPTLDARTLSADLARILLPAAVRAEGIRTVVLVPDRFLSSLAFPALREKSKDEYLIQRFEVVLTPSGTFFVGATPGESRPPLRTLVVGNPRFDREKFPELPNLPQSATEAREVAAMYPGAISLSGLEATRESFLAALTRSTVVHFAGHALLNLDKPFSSAVVLAPAGGDSGLLYAHEITRLRLNPGASVVLAACSTARGKDLTMEGSVSLARGFLAAGARAVIASPEPVEDSSTQPLLASFHRFLIQAQSPASALRAAQLAAIAEGARPADWAFFSVTGNIGALWGERRLQ